MLRLLKIIWVPVLLELMTGCAHMKQTCSFRLDFIDAPPDIGDYSLVEVNSVKLLRTAPWGFELYSDAMTNVNSMAFTTQKSLRHYRLFLEDLKRLGKGELVREMESVRPGLVERLPDLDVQALLRKRTSIDCPDDEMISISRDLAGWIWASQEHSWTVKELRSVPMLSNLKAIYYWGGIADILGEDYWVEGKRKQRLQSLAYACVLSEKDPVFKRLCVDESHKIRDRMMEHGRVPLPVRVDVVDERKFVFKDCNLRPFAELTMSFDYGYSGAFKEVNMDSKMVLDLAIRALLQRCNKGSRVMGDIRHDFETGEIQVEVKECPVLIQWH